MNHNETGQQPYTKVSLVFKFLHGSKRYFLISIAAALCVTGVDMLSPQLIRTTVDGILGENALQLPRFLVDLVERIGGVGYLRERLWLIGGLLVLLALLSVTFRYLFILFNAKGRRVWRRQCGTACFPISRGFLLPGICRIRQGISFSAALRMWIW